MTTVSRGEITITNVDDGKTPYFHTAYAWSADGTDRFTPFYPNENILTGVTRARSPRVQPYQDAAISYTDEQSVQEWGATDAVKHVVAGNTGANDTVIGLISGDGQTGSLDNTWGHSIYVKNVGSTEVKFSNNMKKYVTVLPGESKRIEMIGKPSSPITAIQLIVYRKQKSDTLEFIVWHAKIEVNAEPFTEPTIWTPSPIDDPINAYPTYIGTYSDHEPTDSEDSSKYTWSRLLGNEGADGKTPYFHTAYTNSTDFGTYDYSGNPNLISNASFSSLSRSASTMSHVAEGVTDHGDYFEIDCDIEAPAARTSVFIPFQPRILPNVQYTLSVTLEFDEVFVASGASQSFTYGSAIDGKLTRPVTIIGKKEVGRNRVSATFTAPSNYTVDKQINPFFQFWFADTSKGKVRVYYDIKLEKGAIATPYQPNLLDAPYYLSKVPLGENIRRIDNGTILPITTTEYLAGQFNVKEPYVVGQTYTFTMKATKPNTQYFAPHLRGGTLGVGAMTSVDGLTDVWQITYTVTQAHIDSGANAINIFQMPQSTAGTINIEWAKLEKGNTRTPNIDAYKYLGNYTDFVQTDSLNPTQYAWSQIKGNDSTSYSLLLSSQVMSLPRGASKLVPENVTISGMAQTGEKSIENIKSRIVVEETTNGTTWTTKYDADALTYTYTPSSLNVLSARVKMYIAGAKNVQLDQKSINIVKDGSNGSNGSSSYTWVRYSKNVDGNPMTTIPNVDSKYIGIAITSSNIPPTSYSAYAWARIKGDGGLKNRLYTETGANVNQEPIEIFNETQSDGDIVEPENITWYVAKESSNKFTAIGSNKSINLVRNSSDEWSTPITGFTGIQNYCPMLSFVDIAGLKIGDKINIYIEVKYDNIVAASGQTASFYIQGSGNNTGWSSGGFPANSTYGRLGNVSGSGSVIFKYSTTITSAHLENNYWNTQMRCDYIQSGSIQYKNYKIEKSLSGNGEDYTPWTPATGKDNDIYTGQPNLFSGTEEPKNIDVDTTTYTAFDPYITDNNKTLAEQGYNIGDQITISVKWSISKNKELTTRYGFFHIEGFQSGAGFTGSFSTKTTFSESNTSGTVIKTLTLNETMLKTNRIRFRIDNSTLNFSVEEFKIEPGNLNTPWAPSLGDNRGIFITKNNSIIVSPSYFLNENSTTFRADVDYETMKSSDQIAITNKAFDAMRPLILRQPVAPQNPYPGLLWMDTSSVDNYIYRWGRTPRQEPNGVKYTHYAYTNSIEDWQDFTVNYPYANEIRNGVNINDTSFWTTRMNIMVTDHGFYPNGKTLRVENTSVKEDYIYANNKAYRPLKAAGSVYTFGMTGFMNTNCKGVDVFILARPVGSTSDYTLATTLVASKIFSSVQAEKLVVNWTVPSTWTGNLEYILRFDHNGSKTDGASATFYMADVYFREGKQDTTAPALPSPLDDPDYAYMSFVGTYVDKTKADSTDPNMYHWTSINDKSNYRDDSGENGVESEDFVTVYDWGWIILTEEEKEGIPWLNNEDGSTIIDWIYQITQNTSDSSIVNKVIGSEDMKNVYASSDALNELVGSNDELAQKMNEYNQIIQDYASQINSTYENMTEMQQTIDKFLFNIESAGGVNILKNSTGFQYDDETKTFYQWTKELVDDATIKQEMGNQTLNDLGFVSGFRINGRQLEMYQDVFLPAADIEYTMSGFISKQTTGNAPNNFSIRIINLDNGQEISSTGSTEDINTMSKFSTTFTSPTVNVRIVISLTGKNESGSSILVAGLMLNIGPFPLSWQSHHEEVYSTNVRMDGSGLKVFNNDYEGYNVITPKEFAGYYKTDGEDYEKVFTLNQDTTEVKKLQAEERFMMKPIQIVSIESETTPGWAFVGYGNDNTNSWNPNLLYNITIPSVSDTKYLPRLRKQVSAPWMIGNPTRSQPEKKVLRLTSSGGELSYRFGSGSSADDINLLLAPGKTYTLSLDVRYPFDNQYPIQFRAEYYTTSWSQVIQTPLVMNSSTEFERKYITFTVPTNAVRYYIGLQTKNLDGTWGSMPTNVYFDFKNPKIEIGNVMTLP